ncbi:MAG: hypothetical protein AAGB22_11485, partial [Bacteroidota bacterium]
MMAFAATKRYTRTTRWIVPLLAALLWGNLAVAGNPERAEAIAMIRNMHRVYHQATAFHIKMDLSMIPRQPGLPAERMTGQVKHRGDGYFIQMGDRVNLLNTKGHLVVDHQRQKLLWQPARDVAATLESLRILPDEALFEGSEITFLENTPTRKRLKVVVPEPQLDHLELELDAEGKLTALRYFYTDDPQIPYREVRIDFALTDLAPVFERQAFSEAPYLQKVKGQWQPATAYR